MSDPVARYLKQYQTHPDSSSQDANDPVSKYLKLYHGESEKAPKPPTKQIPVPAKRPARPEVERISTRDGADLPRADVRGGAEVLRKTASSVKEGLGQVADFVRHPIESAKAIAHGVVESGKDASRPIIGNARGPQFGYDPAGLPIHGDNVAKEGEIVTKENTRDAIPLGQALRGKVNSAVNVASLYVNPGTLAGRAAMNAGIGAINDPEKPLRGATAGAVLGETLHGATKAAGKVAPVVAREGSKAVERTAEAVKPVVERAKEATHDAFKRLKRPPEANSPAEHVAEHQSAPPSETAAPGQVNIRRMRVEDIHADPSRFQYKSGTDANSGAGAELKGLSKFDESLAGVVSVWRDPADGKVYAVNGHHRLELAKRTGHPSLNVQEIPAKTADEARAAGALANIAEGRGTATDAAQFFRSSGLGPDDLKERVSFKGIIAKNGMGLSKLAPDLFDKVVRGDFSEGNAAVIGSMLDKPELQRAALNAIEKSGKRLSEGEAREVARQVLDAGSERTNQESLFGTESVGVPLYVEKAQLAAAITRRLGSDKRLFGYVAKEGRAGELARAGNQIDVEGSRKVAEEAGQLEEVFRTLYTRKGPIADALTEAARKIANGERPNALIEQLYPAIREAVQEALPGREGASNTAPGVGNSERESQAGYDTTGRQASEFADEVDTRVPDSTDPAQGGFELHPDDLEPSSLRAPRSYGSEGNADVLSSPAELRRKADAGERIEVPAIRVDGEHVVEGKSIDDAFDRALAAGLLDKSDIFSDRVEAGYLTSSGRLVSGKEAIVLAQHAGQLRKSSRFYHPEAGVIPLATARYHGEFNENSLKGIKRSGLAEPHSPTAGEIGDSSPSSPNDNPRIVSRAVHWTEADGDAVRGHLNAVDEFSPDGTYNDRTTGQRFHRPTTEGYKLSDGSFVTREEAKEMFGDADFGPEGRGNSGPLFSPEKGSVADLFNNPPSQNQSNSPDDQGSLFSKRAGTVASRSLEQTERGARSEIQRLKQVLSLETNPQARTEAARQLATLEKLVNRDKAISPEELATRSIAEKQESSMPHPGPDQGVLLSPASEVSGLGARIRSALGIKNSNVGEVVALRKITRSLAEATGVPIREGRGNLKRMRAMGAFWQKPEMIRVRRFKAVDTASHEVGHYLDKKYQIRTAAKGLPKADRAAVGKELVAMGRALYGARVPNGGYASEGVAQWFRFFVTERERTVAEAPAFSRYMNEILNREPALLDALNKAHDEFARYQAAPANEKVGSMIERSAPSRFDGIDPSRLIDHWFNDLRPIQRAQDALGKPTDITKNAAILAELTKGNSGRARDMLKNGVVKFGTSERVTPGMQDILREVGEKNRDAFTEYLVAEQVLTKTSQGIDTGFDVPAAREVAEAGRRNPSFVKGAKEVWEFRSALLDYMADAGLMTKDEVKGIRAGNPTPTPFYRYFDPSEGGAGGQRGGSSALARNSAGVHRMRGSDRPILDPLQSIVSDAYNMVDRAHKHEAATVLIKVALDTEGGARFADLLPEVPKELRQINLERVREQLLDAGWNPPEDPALLAAMNDVMLSAFYEKTRPGAREVRDQVLPILIKGERKWVQVNDQRLWEAIEGMSIPELGLYERIITAPTRMLRMGATQVNPDFAIVNPLRDAWPAAIYSAGPSHLPGYSIIKGLGHLLRERFGDGDKLAERWAQMGGENSGVVGADKRTITKQYQQTVADLMASPQTRIRDAILHPVELMRKQFEVLENATRLGEFGSVRQTRMAEGAPEPRASMEGAYSARNVTQDFFKAGSRARVANRYIPFFSAHLGEIYKLASEFNPVNLRTPEGRARYATVTARAAAFITAPSIALYLLQKDDPDYQEIPEYVKANSWVIVDHEHGPVPLTLEGGKQTRIWIVPRPHLLGYTFGYMPEKFLEYAQTQDPEALKELAKQSWSAFTPPVVPTILGPLIENYANRSLFNDRPIVPKHVEGLEASEQVTPYTGETARLIGKAVNYSPAKIENVVRGYTGGAGVTVKDAIDAGVRKTREGFGMEPLSAPQSASGDPLDRTPVVGRFIASKPGADSKSVARIYSDYANAEVKRKTWLRMMKEGRSAAAREYFEANKPEILSVATEDDAGQRGELREIQMYFSKLAAERRALAASVERPEVKAQKDRELQTILLNTARDYYARQGRR